MAFNTMKWLKNKQNLWIGYRISCGYRFQYIFLYVKTRKGESVELVSDNRILRIDENRFEMTIKANSESEAIEMIRNVTVNKSIVFGYDFEKTSERLLEVLC